MDYSDLYSYQQNGDSEVLEVAEPTNIGCSTILTEIVGAAVKRLKREKSPGADNIQAELIMAGGLIML